MWCTICADYALNILSLEFRNFFPWIFCFLFSVSVCRRSSVKSPIFTFELGRKWKQNFFSQFSLSFDFFYLYNISHFTVCDSLRVVVVFWWLCRSFCSSRQRSLFWTSFEHFFHIVSFSWRLETLQLIFFILVDFQSARVFYRNILVYSIKGKLIKFIWKLIPSIVQSRMNKLRRKLKLKFRELTTPITSSSASHTTKTKRIAWSSPSQPVIEIKSVREFNELIMTLFGRFQVDFEAFIYVKTSQMESYQHFHIFWNYATLSTDDNNKN